MAPNQELQSLLAVTAADWPGRADAVRLAAQLAYGRHDLHRATELLQTLMQLAPADESGRWALVQLLMRRSDLAAAWRTLTAAPQPLDPRNVVEAQMWIELHRRYGPADQTVNGSVALLRRFCTSEQFSAYVLTSLLAPGSSRDPLPPAVVADFHRAIDAFFQQWPDSPYLRRISTDDTSEFLARLTEMVTPSDEELVHRRRLTRDLMIGRLPLGILTQAIKRSYTEIIIRRGVVVIPALHPDPREFTASMTAVRSAIDKDVAIGIDALAVLATLPAGVRELVTRSFSRLVTTERGEVLHGGELAGISVWEFVVGESGEDAGLGAALSAAAGVAGLSLAKLLWARPTPPTARTTPAAVAIILARIYLFVSIVVIIMFVTTSLSLATVAGLPGCRDLGTTWRVTRCITGASVSGQFDPGSRQ